MVQIRLQKRGHQSYVFSLERDTNVIMVSSGYPNKFSALTEIDGVIKGLFTHLIALTDHASPTVRMTVQALGGAVSGVMAVKLRQMMLVDETGEQ